MNWLQDVDPVGDVTVLVMAVDSWLRSSLKYVEAIFAEIDKIVPVQTLLTKKRIYVKFCVKREQIEQISPPQKKNPKYYFRIART